jgi:cytochrome c biogenesis protein CcmG, thiol:disulfide interchange protein DsbE
VRTMRRSTLLGCAAAVLLAAAAIGVLVSGGSAPAAAPVRARPFTLAMLGSSGRHVSLTQYAGRPVVVNFFASWCTPCQKETPLLAAFYRSHRGQVAIIGVDSNDLRNAALAFVRARGVSYPVGFDPSATVADSYGVQALPQTFFLNARHQIVRHVIGSLTSRELTSWAASLPHPNGAS